LKLSVLKVDCSCLIISFYAISEMACSLLLLFNHSITIMESSRIWITSMFNLDAKWSVAQAPNNFALVLVLGPQLKIHLYCEFIETLIKPLAPLCMPLDWTAPSNHSIDVPYVISVMSFVLFTSLLGCMFVHFLSITSVL